MNHPAHEGPFNKTAENASREKSGPTLELSGEFKEVAERERELDEAAKHNGTPELVVAGGVTAAGEKVKKLIPEASASTAEGPTYRQETEYNDDGSQNVNWPKE